MADLSMAAAQSLEVTAQTDVQEIELDLQDAVGHQQQKEEHKNEQLQQQQQQNRVAAAVTAAAEDAGNDTSTWPPERWDVGLKCDAQDSYGTWCQAKVLKVEQHRVKIHYRGWGREDGKSKWDEWIPKLDARLCAFATKSNAPVKTSEVADPNDDAIDGEKTACSACDAAAGDTRYDLDGREVPLDTIFISDTKLATEAEAQQQAGGGQQCGKTMTDDDEFEEQDTGEQLVPHPLGPPPPPSPSPPGPPPGPPRSLIDSTVTLHATVVAVLPMDAVSYSDEQQGGDGGGSGGTEIPKPKKKKKRRAPKIVYNCAPEVRKAEDLFSKYTASAHKYDRVDEAMMRAVLTRCFDKDGEDFHEGLYALWGEHYPQILLVESDDAEFESESESEDDALHDGVSAAPEPAPEPAPAPAPAQAPPSREKQEAGLCEYERQRLANIRRNEEQLRVLGLTGPTLSARVVTGGATSRSTTTTKKKKKSLHSAVKKRRKPKRGTKKKFLLGPKTRLTQNEP